MATEINELTEQYLRAKAIRDCNNLMGKFEFYFSDFRMKQLVKLWANRPDCTLEVPYGCYEGIGGIKRCFLQDYGDRNDPNTQKYMEGTMMVHGCSTENIIVANDLQTVRAAYISNGIETFGKGIQLKDYRNKALWRYAKYGVDFILEDGQWKIWHLHVYQLFETPWETCWTEAQPYAGYPIRPTHIDREPIRPIYQWTMTTKYPHDEPLPPKPYDKFEDVEPGYGYFA